MSINTFSPATKILTLSVAALGLNTLVANDTAAAYRCALGLDKCAIVYSELRFLVSSEARDHDLFRHLPSYSRKMKVIERDTERTKQRLRLLARDIANEIARLKMCDAAARVAALEGRDNNDPRCVDQF